MDTTLPYREPTPKFSKLVVVALILAGLSFPFSVAAGVPAWIVGFVAERRIRRQPEKISGLKLAEFAQNLALMGSLFLPIVVPVLIMCLRALVGYEK